MGDITAAVRTAGEVIDGLGVLVIVVGLFVASARFARRVRRGEERPDRRFRADVGRAVLLGLEFLVAGDIIRTVAVDPTLDDVLVLGLIVVIRTLLSVALEVELEGRWPWRRSLPPDAGTDTRPDYAAGHRSDPIRTQ